MLKYEIKKGRMKIRWKKKGKYKKNNTPSLLIRRMKN
jgi:hypothetical protein